MLTIRETGDTLTSARLVPSPVALRARIPQQSAAVSNSCRSTGLSAPAQRAEHLHTRLILNEKTWRGSRGRVCLLSAVRSVLIKETEIQQRLGTLKCRETEDPACTQQRFCINHFGGMEGETLWIQQTTPTTREVTTPTTPTILAAADYSRCLSSSSIPFLIDY